MSVCGRVNASATSVVAGRPWGLGRVPRTSRCAIVCIRSSGKRLAPLTGTPQAHSSRVLQLQLGTLAILQLLPEQRPKESTMAHDDNVALGLLA